MTRVVVLSGGMDSTTALALAIHAADAEPVRAVSFYYGQRHARELDAAAAIAATYGIPHEVVSLEGLMSGSSLIDGGEVPEGHYADDTMSATVVNGRNLLFASAAVAQCTPGDSLWLGVHAGDHPVYPDCRPEFWTALGLLVFEAYGVRVVTPFLNVEKAQVAVLAEQYGAPLHLSWSCYKGEDLHCGRCGTCVERAEAFHLANLPDPTEYADPTFWRTATA